MSKYALLSCTDKSNLVPFAKGLVAHGLKILSTGGTAKVLADADVPYTSVADYTGQKEILSGRVKTLHPKVHAGILANRSASSDMKTLEEQAYSEIEVVAVNLYPFEKQVVQSDKELSPTDIVEFIDIGGPTMLRAAAKNYHSVYSVIDPNDYEVVLEDLKQGGSDQNLRRKLAAKVFATTAAYDLMIASTLSSEDDDVSYMGRVLQAKQKLRYGENPHQKAFWCEPVVTDHTPFPNMLMQLQGKELSYNNLNDLDAALRLSLDLSEAFPQDDSVVIIKHANPCGVSVGEGGESLFERALACDPVSAFGGIISCDFEIGPDLAKKLVSSFYEIILAPSFDMEALEVFKAKKNLRVLAVDFDVLKSQGVSYLKMKSLLGTDLIQSPDTKVVPDLEWVVGDAYTRTEEKDALLAWVTCKHVKSNAIVLASGGDVIGVGAGQMNRVDSSRLAIERATRNGFSVEGSSAASDAFFPFPDNVELLSGAGVGLILQPGGSIKDEEVFAAAKECNVKMQITGVRHFNH